MKVKYKALVSLLAMAVTVLAMTGISYAAVTGSPNIKLVDRDDAGGFNVYLGTPYDLGHSEWAYNPYSYDYDNDWGEDHTFSPYHDNDDFYNYGYAPYYHHPDYD